LREAAQWKAKALQAQQAAQELKKKAHLLKEKAVSAVESYKELTFSFRKAKNTAQSYRQEADELARQARRVEDELQRELQEKKTISSRSAALEQQLTLFRTAIEETRRGSDLQSIQESIRSALTNPEAEEFLRLRLKVKEEEIESLRSEKEGLRDDLRASRAVFESKLRKLQQENKSLRAEVVELKESNAKADSDHAYTEQRLIQQLRDSQFQLGQRTLALARQEQELEIHRSDNQSLVEELYREAELLRSEVGLLNSEKLEIEQRLEEKVTLLEDERSDLEIVNVELAQRIAELES
jgi:chromosome segregation ATPase